MTEVKRIICGCGNTASERHCPECRGYGYVYREVEGSRVDVVEVDWSKVDGAASEGKAVTLPPGVSYTSVVPFVHEKRVGDTVMRWESPTLVGLLRLIHVDMIPDSPAWADGLGKYIEKLEAKG